MSCEQFIIHLVMDQSSPLFRPSQPSSPCIELMTRDELDNEISHLELEAQLNDPSLWLNEAVDISELPKTKPFANSCLRCGDIVLVDGTCDCACHKCNNWLELCTCSTAKTKKRPRKPFTLKTVKWLANKRSMCIQCSKKLDVTEARKWMCLPCFTVHVRNLVDFTHACNLS